MKKAFCLCAIIFIIELIVAVCILPDLPETIPMHWNAKGIADGFGGKWTIFLVPLITFPAVAFQALILSLIMQNNDNLRRSSFVCGISIIVMKFVYSGIFIGEIIAIKGAAPSIFTIDRIAFAICGIGFIILGNFFPKIKQNAVFGVRTPETLKSEVVWQKTHRFGGWLVISAGIFFVLSILIPSPLNLWLPLCYSGLCIAITLFYSHQIYKKENL